MACLDVKPNATPKSNRKASGWQQPPHPPTHTHTHAAHLALLHRQPRLAGQADTRSSDGGQLHQIHNLQESVAHAAALGHLSRPETSRAMPKFGHGCAAGGHAEQGYGARPARYAWGHLAPGPARQLGSQQAHTDPGGPHTSCTKAVRCSAVTSVDRRRAALNCSASSTVVSGTWMSVRGRGTLEGGWAPALAAPSARKQ
jgi:hypothetical protein